MTLLKTVYEQAVETGEKTFPVSWQFIQRRVAVGDSHEAIAAALREAMKSRRMSAEYWQWVEDATTAARHRSAIEADRRRRQFRLIKLKENDR